MNFDNISRAFTLFGQRWKDYAIASLPLVITSLLYNVIAIGAQFAFLPASNQQQPDLGLVFGVLALQFGAMFAYFVVYAWNLVGLFRMATLHVTEQRFSWVDALKQGKAGWSAFGAALIIGVAISVGIMFCCIPGILLMGLYMITYPLIFDKGLGAWEALSTSWRTLVPYLWPAAGFSFIMYLLLSIGGAMCGIGLIAMAPVYALAFALVYFDNVVGRNTVDRPSALYHEPRPAPDAGPQ